MTRQTSTDYRHPHRPWPLALANGLGARLARMGLAKDGLGRADLMDTAAGRAGWSDFGRDGLEERLDILLAALRDEARLHPIGRLMARENLLRILVNRLRMNQAWSAQPDILRLPTPRPVFIVGLQRTGTTMLHRLLAADPAFRFLASWEAINPAPFPPAQGPLARLTAWRGNGDPRIRMARLAQRGLAWLAPDFFAIHPVDATGPEEDCLLFDFAFWSTVPEATWRVPSFSAWLERQDHGQAYRGYAQVLKLLQWQGPGGRWVLKTPQHLEHLHELFATFPDAKVIWTHRDPQKTVASFCSMMAHAWGVFSDRVDPLDVAAHWAQKTRRMVEQGMAARADLGEERFFDVHYPELVADPLGQVQAIYQFLNQDLSAEALTRMQRWRNQNPQHKHGQHRYRLSDFGLDQDRVDAMYQAYRNRFGVDCED